MKPVITVVSLGPGDPELMNLKTVRALRGADRPVLRTGRHPAADWLREQGQTFETLDALYETAEDFDALSRLIADTLWQKAWERDIVYGVVDASFDQSVVQLKEQMPAGACLTVLPGAGLANAYLAAAGPLPQTGGLRVCPASQLLSTSVDPNHSLLITELDNALLAGDVKELLSEILSDDHPLLLLQGEAAPQTIPLYELDRQSLYDHRTAVLIPGSGSEARSCPVMPDLLSLMRQEASASFAFQTGSFAFESLRQPLLSAAERIAQVSPEQDPDALSSALGELLSLLLRFAAAGRQYDAFSWSDLVRFAYDQLREDSDRLHGDFSQKSDEK